MKNRIKELREKNHFSQKYVALCIGVSASVVSQWEAGIKKPSQKSIKKLAELFKCSSDYILGLTSDDLTDITADEQALIDAFRTLNLTGKKRAIETLTLFNMLPEYQYERV